MSDGALRPYVEQRLHDLEMVAVVCSIQDCNGALWMGDQLEGRTCPTCRAAFDARVLIRDLVRERDALRDLLDHSSWPDCGCSDLAEHRRRMHTKAPKEGEAP